MSRQPKQKGSTLHLPTYSEKHCPPELKNVKFHKGFGRNYDPLYKIAAELAPTQTWAEFGVGSGYNTTMRLAKLLKPEGQFFLFDSWEGIPEPWKLSDTLTEPVGKWQFPRIKQFDDRLVITDGLFADVLPIIFPEQLGLVSIDCDIYSSTRDVFNGIRDYVEAGTVIIFDELIGYANYREHEYKALQEFLSKTGFNIKYHAKEHFAVVGVLQ